MQLTVYHLFPNQLTQSNDAGNLCALKKRSEWRGIDLLIEEVANVEDVDWKQTDLVYIGSGSDLDQAQCAQAMRLVKEALLEEILEDLPVLAIGGGYSFLGDYCETAGGERIPGAGLVNLHTETDLAGENKGIAIVDSPKFGTIIGFENHNKRTYHSYETLGMLAKGSGNNSGDLSEGLRYHAVIGTHLDGPLLPANPAITDFLLESAVRRRHGDVSWKPLNNRLEEALQAEMKRKLL